MVETRRQQCEAEVQRYLTHAMTHREPFEPFKRVFFWWKTYGELFPQVARQWLGCVATSTPCTRAFEGKGMDVLARRGVVSSSLVEDMVLVAHEFKNVPPA